MKKAREIFHELKHHLPFTSTATFVAILIAIFLYKTDISESIFEFVHPLHILFSSIVSSAIFYKYKKNLFEAIFVGMTGSILIGSISDVIFPYIGGSVFNLKTAFHLPVFETPLRILSVSLIGTIIGIKIEVTKLPHFIHVFLSAFASLFYLMAFSPSINLIFFIISFAVVFIAVIIPCCLSDIVFPFFFLREKIKHCNC
jgi:hypothetical protein